MKCVVNCFGAVAHEVWQLWIDLRLPWQGMWRSRAAMRKAAELWAQARRAGTPTAPDLALDGDVILAAQALLLATQEAEQVVIATTNPGHLNRYTDAQEWSAVKLPPNERHHAYTRRF
jgi:hypothetical protein